MHESISFPSERHARPSVPGVENVRRSEALSCCSAPGGIRTHTENPFKGCSSADWDTGASPMLPRLERSDRVDESVRRDRALVRALEPKARREVVDSLEGPLAGALA